MTVRLRVSILLLVALAFACTGAQHSDDYEAAGIITYTRIQGVTYVLLADHIDSERGWGTFGGHREPGESIPVTASREFREETRCVYDAPAVDELERAPFVTQRKYLSYVMEIPYVPVQVFESRQPPDACTAAVYFERGPFAWVPLADIERTIASVDSNGVYTLPQADVPKGASTRKLWDESATIVLKAIEQGYLK